MEKKFSIKSFFSLSINISKVLIGILILHNISLANPEAVNQPMADNNMSNAPEKTIGSTVNDGLISAGDFVSEKVGAGAQSALNIGGSALLGAGMGALTGAISGNGKESAKAGLALGLAAGLNSEFGLPNSGGILPGGTSSSSRTNTSAVLQPKSNPNCRNGTAFCGVGIEGGAAIAERNLDHNISKEHDLKKLIIGWTSFLLSIAALLAVIAIVWAGILYITALGDDGRMETAKKIIIWVIIGIIVILGAYAIVRTIISAAFT